MFEEVFKISAAIIASVGGAGVIILGLSSWLAKLWAEKLMQSQKHTQDKAIEELRSSLQKDVQREIEDHKSIHQQHMDLLLRKREIYQSLATSMRVFINGGMPINPAEKAEFLKCYDLCFIWASDDLVSVMKKFLSMLVDHTSGGSNYNQTDIKTQYAYCLIEMRKDAGFPDTLITPDSYVFVSF